jgi:pimeloyl-ACP methyl ester carboxylesterase
VTALGQDGASGESVKLPGRAGSVTCRPGAVRVHALPLAACRRGNARIVSSLMHAIDGFRRPRPDSVMSDGELGQITAPTMFCWGTGDPFLTPAQARPSIAMIPGAVLREVPGGHGPWLEDPAGCAKLATSHFTATGFAPATRRRDPAAS